MILKERLVINLVDLKDVRYRKITVPAENTYLFNLGSI